MLTFNDACCRILNYRAGGEYVRENGSTGLRLYMVKKILTMHKAGFGVRNIKVVWNSGSI